MSVRAIIYVPSKHPPEASLDWDHTVPPVCREEADVVVLLVMGIERRGGGEGRGRGEDRKGMGKGGERRMR
jgi:hypothetical protein